MTWQNLFSYKLFGVVKLLIHNRNRKNNIMKAFYKTTVSAYITHESDLSFLAQIFEKKTQKPGRYYAMININIKNSFPLKHAVVNNLKYYLLFKCCCLEHLDFKTKTRYW